jgi:predicted small lipoprotein YifL
MKILKSTLLVLWVLSVTACAMRMPLLTTPAVSMTNPSFAPDHKATDLGPVSARYCYGEDAITKKGDSVGLMDEVTMRAQKEKNATYIANASYSYEGASCIVLDGTAMK